MRWRLIDFLGTTSLRGRLTLWNAAVVLLMTVATLLAVRHAARATLYDDADEELRAAAREVTLALEDLHPRVDAVVAEMKRKAESHERRGWFLHLLTQEGTMVWQSEHCPDEVASFPPRNLDREENIAQVGPYRYVRLRLAREGQPTYHIRVGTYTTGLDASLGSLMRQLSALGVVLSLLAPLIAYWLAGRATRPVGNILRTAARLRPTRLGDRLPVRGTQDELDRLAETINGLLDSVADHVERQEQFVADAAHELRGPLAALQSSLEVAMSHDDVTQEQHDRLGDMLEVSRHLSKLTNDLLLLAESGADSRPANRAAHDIATIAGQSVGMFAGVAEDKGVHLMLVADRPVIGMGEAGELRRVTSNLLDNAIRFTPAGGSVEVRVTEAPDTGGAVLAVADTGTGIAPPDLAHIFDRFYKADPARSHGGAGRSGGLGLAICKAIVESCGGTIGIASRLGAGTTVTVTLPPFRQHDQRDQPPQSAHSAGAAFSRAMQAARPGEIAAASDP